MNNRMRPSKPAPGDAPHSARRIPDSELRLRFVNPVLQPTATGASAISPNNLDLSNSEYL